ncbi:hypothetical protein [Idiomarina sp.]|uniref:hypothetical protein n=1 Tax=Idiomarina sp. TaxID=1874361 RepID=UPI0025C40015|nr:hypothetical protein [Idiomarina sp.]
MYQEPSPENRSEILKRYNQTERMLRSCEVLKCWRLVEQAGGVTSEQTSCRLPVPSVA